MADQNQLMMVNPFEALETGRKRAYAGYEAGQAAAQREALNELYAKAVDPRTGQVNMNALYAGLAERRMGAAIPGMQQAQADIAFKQAQATKQLQDADTAFWTQSRAELATIPENDQAAFQAWAGRVMRRAPWAAQYLPATLTADSKKQLLMTADAALPKGVEVSRGGATEFRDPYTGKIIGESIPNVPEPEAVVRQKERVARADAPPSPSKKFVETFGANIADQFNTLYTQAQNAESSLDLSRRLQPLLNNPKFISGTLGNVRLEIAKALGLEGAEDTQAYFSGIGGQVAQIIKAFGAGTGLSDSDLKFAERMAGGSQELTVDTIKKIVRLNDEASKYVIKRYNKRRSELSAKEPELSDYYPEVRVIVREGTLDGRRVVEYSDGTIEYVGRNN
jgi:hypothetical protein